MNRSKERISTNPRVLAVYGNNRIHANIEYTLPAMTSALYESPLVTNNPQIRAVVEGGLRVVVTPDMYAGFSTDLQALTKIMSSPYECGRVLEADETVEIDGKEYVVNFKGVGATTIARNGSVAYRGYMDMREPMARYPFYDGYGELEARDAMQESVGVDHFTERGLDTEKILGIYEITQLPDLNGDYLPPSVLRSSGFFRGKPVILVRASKSNFRLLDSVTMYERRQRLVIPPYREFVLDQFAKAEGVSKPDLSSYLRFVSQKVVGQELPLITEGFQMCSGGPAWQNLARNVSTMGEELDLEAVGKSMYLDHPYTWFDYPHHIATQVGNIDSTIRAMADTMTYDGPRVDFEFLADAFWLGVKRAVEGLNLGRVLEELPDIVRANYKITGENRLLSLIYQGITSIYKGNILYGSYSVPQKEGVRVYQEKMVKHVHNESKGLEVI